MWEQRQHKKTNEQSLLFQKSNCFCRKIPSAFHPDKAIQGTAARAMPPMGTEAQPQICTIPGPGIPTACPHIRLHAGSKPAARKTTVCVSPGWHDTCRAVASLDAKGARKVLYCIPPPVGHTCILQECLSASFSRETTRGTDF